MRANEILSAMTWAAFNMKPEITAATANAIDTEVEFDDTVLVVVVVVVPWGFNVAMQLKTLDLIPSLGIWGDLITKFEA